MKISRRRYEKKLAATRWKALGEGQLRGRQETMDTICDWFGRMRVVHAGIPKAYSAFLKAQAFVEGHRQLAYFYDDLSVQEVIEFSDRFIGLRIQNQGATQHV
jgi:hypothetical protein